MSINGISALERGYRRTPQHETLSLLASALGLAEEQRAAFAAAAVQSATSRRKAPEPVAVPTSHRALLPVSLNSFVGRDTELHEIEALLRDYRLVTVTGSGGIGKTQAALRAAAALEDDHCAAVFVGLSSTGSLPGIFAAIASAVGVREMPHRLLHETLFSFLKDRALLIVLDNCEHVIADVTVAANAMLTACPYVRILATSLAPMRAAGERTYMLPPLEQNAAVELFTDRARAIDYHFALNGENEGVVGDVCRRLDGIPLAIELAAARVNVLPPKQLAARLDERFRVLTGGERNALPRHQTMRALIDWSYDLLSARERAIFRKLSVFSGGFTLETAHAVCADDVKDEIEVLDLLSSLVDKSLVQADPTGDARYRMTESTRQYANERLVEAGERETAVRAHAAAFVALAEQLDRMYDTTPDNEWYGHAEPELENVRAALRWAFEEEGDVRCGQQLAGASRQMWAFFAAEGRRWTHCALESTDKKTPAGIIARLELAAALFDSALVEHSASASSAQRALEHFSKLEDSRGAAYARRYHGRALVFLDRAEEAEPLLREALATFRSQRNGKMTGAVLEDLALARQHCGDLPQARQLYDEALEHFKKSGAERNVANAATNLAELEYRCGDTAKALALAEQALAAERAGKHLLKMAHGLSNITAYLVALERYDDARERAREALVLSVKERAEMLMAATLQHLAAVAALGSGKRGDAAQHARAARLLGFADAHYVKLGAVLDYTERQEHDRLAVALREVLGPKRLAALKQEGSAWERDEAVAEALLV
jgi:predicted ATPase